jgi:hypothetical protein
MNIPKCATSIAFVNFGALMTPVSSNAQKRTERAFACRANT